MNDERQELPLGTVVTLKDSKIPLMIVCQVPVTEVNGEKGYFDFGATTLPLGLTGPDKNLFFFNKEDIEDIVFLGYVDISFQEFLTKKQNPETIPLYPKLNVSDLKEK